MVGRHAGHVGRFAPKRLGVAKTVAHLAKRPLCPSLVAKAGVVIGGSCGSIGVALGLERVTRQLRRQRRQLQLPTRRQGQMPGPVCRHQRQRNRRNAAGQWCACCV